MEFEWDPAKAKANLAKHGVSFADAVTALEDEFALTIADPDAPEERRFVSVGVDARGRTLLCVFTLRGETIRIISARKASRRERERYEDGK